jgi:hypothetical protein
VAVNGIKFFMPNEICFIKFLISKAVSLESFVATFRSEIVTKCASPIFATFIKASPQAKISVILHPDVRVTDDGNAGPSQ